MVKAPCAGFGNTLRSSLRNLLGEEVFTNRYHYTQSVRLEPELQTGYYLLEVTADNGQKATQRIIIE